MLFTINRLVLLTQYSDQIPDNSTGLLTTMFFSGLRFDSVIVNISLFLPAVLVILNYFRKSYSALFQKGLTIYLTTILIFFVASILTDVYYYEFFGSRLNRAVFSWMGSPSEVANALFMDLHFLPIWIILFPSIFGVYIMIKKLVNRFLGGKFDQTTPLLFSIQSILICLLLFTGARGNLDFTKLPLTPKETLFCKYTLLNNLTINPVFSLVHSFNNREIDFLSKEQAFKNIQTHWGFVPIKKEYPLARLVENDSIEKHKNVVVVIMESMSANEMGIYNHPGYTPYLDSLARNAICYPNIYTAGIHTHNGIYATLYGHPALLDRIAMREAALKNQHYYGLPQILKERGYQNYFFATADKEFDNMDSFLPLNGYDKFIAKDFFDKKHINNKWGVPDHILFNNTIAFLDSTHAKGKPFLATYMTISTHAPWGIPKGISFKATANNAQHDAYQYEDWSIQQFMAQAKKKPWYKETVFMFIADHGQIFDMVYEMPLSYHHCPLIIFDPEKETKKWDEKIGLQLDAFPTLLDYLNFNYENNTLGESLTRRSRPFAYFTADNKIGVLDAEHFYIRKTDGSQALYEYKSKSLDDVKDQFPQKVKVMEAYAFSMLQSSHEMIKSYKVDKPK